MNQASRYLLKTIGIGAIVGLVIFAVIVGLQVLSGREITFSSDLWVELIYYAIYSIVLSLLNGMWFDYLNHRVQWERYAKYRLLIGFVGSILVTMIGIFLIRMLIEMVFEQEDWRTFINGEKLSYYMYSLVITIIVVIFFHALYFYRSLQEKKVKEHKIIAGTASAQFDALKNQLDPHFLFNSLNVLTSLIEENPNQAQKFTTSLSKIYRYVLEQKNKELVSVDEELDFARTYIKLLRMRFEDSIELDILEKSSNPDAKIVPLSLQLLLENAVKHNVVTASDPLRIQVYEEQGNLVVRNNLQEKKVVRKSSGVGLRNIQQRYSILTDRSVRINKAPSHFDVALPILTHQVSNTGVQEAHIEEKRYQKAKERVEAIKGFYGNLISYVFVIPFLWWLNARTTDFPWAIFPTCFWGFGVIMHGLEAYGYNPIWGKRWEEKKIRDLMEKDDF